MKTTFSQIALCSFTMQVWMILTRSAGRFAARAFIASPPIRNGGISAALRPQLMQRMMIPCSSLSARFKSSVSDDSQQLMSTYVDTVDDIDTALDLALDEALFDTPQSSSKEVKKVCREVS
jgi:hypothetical protein